MIIVYQESGRYTTSKNFIMEYLSVSMFGNREDLYLEHIQKEIRIKLWENAHIDIRHQYGFNIDEYPLPTILNIIHPK